MSSDSEKTGLIIICHGSPLHEANAGFIALVQRVAARLGVGNVLPAFFDLLRPNIPDQVAELASRGVTRIVLMPYFLFQGKHVNIDIPEILAECGKGFPNVTLKMLPTLENDPAVEAVVVERLMPLATVIQNENERKGY
jgi:sirohydrochlorin cobaltochelatase